MASRINTWRGRGPGPTHHDWRDAEMNVVLICLDTFRADCVAARGLNPVIKTPNLDRLAAEGVNFRQFVANTPVCSAFRG